MWNLQGMKTFKPYEPDQILLLPPALQDWLPKDHLVYFVSQVVDSLDLSSITDKYEEELRGFPPYHPSMMTKVLIYAYSQGVYSSRKVEKRIQEDIAFRVLAAGNMPDFKCISEFRRRHLSAFKYIFVQVLQLCRKAGLIKMGHVALDGTKIKANASKHKAMSYGRMVEEEKRLKAEIDEMTQKAERVDVAEDKEYGADKRGDELPEELRFREGRLKRIKQAKEALEEETRSKAEQAHDDPDKRGPGGRRRQEQKPAPAPEARAQRNFTDPESRIMRTSDGSFIQGYNAQAAVDTESQVIVAAVVTNMAADSPHLVTVMESVAANTGEMPDEASADAGYYSKHNMDYLSSRHIEAYVPPDKLPHRRKMKPARRGRIPNNLSEPDRMRRKLSTKKGQARYQLRQETVEPVFGQIKEARGFRRFSLRGQVKVDGEWGLVCAVHNLLKLAARRNPRPDRDAA